MHVTDLHLERRDDVRQRRLEAAVRTGAGERRTGLVVGEEEQLPGRGADQPGAEPGGRLQPAELRRGDHPRVQLAEAGQPVGDGTAGGDEDVDVDQGGLQGHGWSFVGRERG